MRLGAIIPSFSHDGAAAFEATAAIEEAGLHGAFCYDHLWPLGEPGKPALSAYPLLGALSQSTTRLTLGTLVARVGLVPDEVLVNSLLTLHELSGHRFIASIGTGDHKSEAENLAYGAPFAPAHLRRKELAQVAVVLRDAGVPVWIGGGSPETNEVARACGVTLNLWAASLARVSDAAQHGSVSWAGPFPKTVDAAVERLVGLSALGIEWVVYGWPGSVEPLVEAARRADLELER